MLNTKQKEFVDHASKKFGTNLISDSNIFYDVCLLSGLGADSTRSLIYCFTCLISSVFPDLSWAFFYHAVDKVSGHDYDFSSSDDDVCF